MAHGAVNRKETENFEFCKNDNNRRMDCLFFMLPREGYCLDWQYVLTAFAMLVGPTYYYK